MAAEIVDNEIFLTARRTKWRKFRLVLYLLFFLIIFVPLFLPVPFAPEVLHDIFSGRNGALITVFVFLLFILSFAILTSCFLYELCFRRRLNKLLLLEILSVPLLFIALPLLFGLFFGETPQRIASVNNGRQPEEFQNQFLGYKMLDCRNLSEEFDVIFLPQYLYPETEYLAYAPRRKDKAIGYILGKKYGDDWYWEASGSMWSDDLRNCKMQNKNPNN